MVGTGICERIWPAERRPVLARDHVQDACFLALHAIVVIPLMTLLRVGAATLIGGHAPWLAWRATERWPGWLLVPLTIVAMDGANWLAHFADHRLHHAPDIQDANLGVVLTIWDVLAGCARFPSRADSVNRTGLDGRPVPGEQEASAGPAPLLAAEQLAEPFRARS